MKKKFTLFLLLAALTSNLNANNVSITNLTITEKNTGSHYSLVQFDISWENSWRTTTGPNNWDAAWVFVKYRVAGGEWQHAWLNNNGYTAPSGSTLDVGFLKPGTAFNATTNPGLGAFVYRAKVGNGTSTFNGVQLRWNYGANGVTDADIVEIQVFAIEMVYVPQGSFYVGDGTTSNVTGQFTAHNTTANYQITSEAIPATLGGTTAGNLGNNNKTGMVIADDFDNATTQLLPSAFPKGYTSFYCMKYEISQQQYVDFLNNLTQTQASTRKYDKPAGNYRYEITGSEIGSYATYNPYIGCNFLTWADVTAYLDWSGLRPMTELEYEKACRGIVSALANEYAWGTATLTQNTGITNANLLNETSTNSGNCTYGPSASVQGPMRVGAFASSSTNRVQAGATYYGIMEMSGNLWERPITVGSADGRLFTGLHGNGVLSPSGLSDVANWPSSGSGWRGGGWRNSSLHARVSARSDAAYPDDNVHGNNYGGRGVRTQLPLVIGDYYQGGKIAYILQVGDPGYDVNLQKGLIAASTDQSTSAQWGCIGTGISGADGTAIGTGNQNTNDIEVGCTTTAIAADICANLTLEGYSDWYLPSKDELNKLFLNKTAIGGFSTAFYYSSSEVDNNHAWVQGLLYGNLAHYSKDGQTYVRAIRTFPTLPAVTTSAATAIAATTANSGGDVTIAGDSEVTARGICWGTSSNPTTALATKTIDGTGTGTFTSSLTGLLPSTLYHIRAYATNTGGTSYGEDKTFTTTAFVCGTSALTVNHLVTGGVAPVDKSVSYGTVSTTLFGGTKCAITQNLGSTNQATAATDNTEASAGWYWQFNLKQGYKLDDDGTTRTPANLWITFIDENSDWATANDPCTLELGIGWHLPTKTEWTTADANGQIGGWDDIAEAYSDVLKLHAAGYLNASDGLMTNRGSIGFYWSSKQYDNIYGWSPAFTSSFSDMSHSSRAFGYSVRCLKDLLPTLTTTDASVIMATTATSGGNITEQGASAVTARGVCWGTSANPTTSLATKTIDGTGTGVFTSSLTGLLPSTIYHIRAYATNTEGTSYGEDKTFTTEWACGSSFAKNHVISGGVAPVDKTVTYSTVSTTLFSGTKCSITQNLGADHQATAVDDATEASAGWYWQFNRKQGYKADCANGSTCFIPSSPAWNTTYDDLSETWEAAKDPCTLELGTGWRIPTNAEWTSADGSWANWTEPWNSVLKLHAAGILRGSVGSLLSRGSGGYYWGSTQSSTAYGWNLNFDSGNSAMYNSYKTNGFTVRCLRDLSPTLTTTDASDINATTATAGGNITGQNASAVTARGVCWSTSANPTTSLATKTIDGTGTGTFTSSLTGLLPSTLYHIRAYATNTEGTSYGEDKTFTTTAFVCGTSALSVNHVVTGGVAPVDKSVSYGTVSTSLFGGTKCAITQNLGADHQAAAVNDATEASAGWYWQFNRKQGYNHTGTTSTTVLTPEWPTTIIDESAEWISDNDPCALELGVGWHIPTKTEWVSADASWSTWSDLWNSELKLHASGRLTYNNGYLDSRGSFGFYWSSTQSGGAIGWYLRFDSASSLVTNYYKICGYSVRCLKD